MRVLLILLPFFVFGLQSCAEQNELQLLLGSWNGSNETQLIKSWGEPDQVIPEGHTRYLVYNRGGPSRSNGPSQPETVAAGCRISFETLDEIIVSSKYVGEKCGLE